MTASADVGELADATPARGRRRVGYDRRRL